MRWWEENKTDNGNFVSQKHINKLALEQGEYGLGMRIFLKFPK